MYRAAVDSNTATSPPPLRPTLNRRQLDILLMLHAGFQNQEIASRLDVALRTVKSYLRELFTIFDVTNRTELLGAAFDLGIIQTMMGCGKESRLAGDWLHKTA